MRTAVFCLLFVSVLLAVEASTPRDQARIRSLPGVREPLGEMYSGYITVDATAGRQLFYWFVPSKNSARDPLVLWLQGNGRFNVIYLYYYSHVVF